MQLDRTRIVIRERTFVDVLDLALHVIRTFAGPLAVAFAVGVLPAMALNSWLLADYAKSDYWWGFPFTYMCYMLALVIWEIPLVTAGITLYLGRWVFMDRVRPGQIARSFFGALPQLVWYQVILRALMVPLVITWSILFASWPYLGEVILLERNPMRSRKGQINTYRRMLVLHGGTFGQSFGRWLGAMAVGGMLFLSLWFSIALVRTMLIGAEPWYGRESWWESDLPMYTLYYPLVLWLVVGYFTVVRFLGYLDLRIRREGWEIELMMRAEQARLTRQLT